MQQLLSGSEPIRNENDLLCGMILSWRNNSRIIGSPLPGRARTLPFTLIELLVVIAIMSILMAMLLPALKKARDMGRGTLCVSNERQISTSIFNYSADNNDWMPISHSTYYNASGVPGGADVPIWKREIAQYLGLSYDLSYLNIKFAQGVFKCPSFDPVPAETAPGTGGYGWNRGGYTPKCGTGYYDADTTFKRTRVKLGTVNIPSETIVCGDTTQDPNWQIILASSEWGGGAGGVPLICIGARHNNGVNMVWVDGHVEWKSRTALRTGKNGDSDWYYKRVK